MSDATSVAPSTVLTVESNGIELNATYQGCMTAQGPEGQFKVNGFEQFRVVGVNKTTSAKTLNGLIVLLSEGREVASAAVFMELASGHEQTLTIVVESKSIGKWTFEPRIVAVYDF
eukprot:c27893_g1_i1.p1 GENE.c27893_g1_i1~~c27893_g1_i1.p1  ORF type:complete len:116 (+),score=15.58 c27893_g1_i1:77-424(+)